MTKTADTTLPRASQTPSPVNATNAANMASLHPIIPATQAALRLFRNALHAEKAGLRSEKAQLCITDQLRRAAAQWDKVEAAFSKASCQRTATQPGADLATLCAQIAIYLDDADNVDGINPRRFRMKAGKVLQSGEHDDVTALIKAAKGMLATYDALLPQATAPEVALAA